MAFKYTVAEKFAFTVKGTVNDIDGKEEEFEIKFFAHRRDAETCDAIQAGLIAAAAKTGTHTAVNEKLAELVYNWDGPRDETDAPVPFSTDALAHILKSNSGLGLLIWHGYRANVGAKAKN